MTTSSRPYDYDFATPFQKQFKKLKDRRVQTQIKEYIEEHLTTEPYDYSIRLKDESNTGLRRSQIGDFRVSFVICEECRKELWRGEYFTCEDCDEKSDKFLRFMQVGHRGKFYGK